VEIFRVLRVDESVIFSSDEECWDEALVDMLWEEKKKTKKSENDG
jgi:hypothetical protein